MPPHKIRLKSQYPSSVAKPPVWVRRLVHYALIFGTFTLIANAIVGEKGLTHALAARQRHRALADDISLLRLENEELRQTATRLREDPLAIEEVARGELGMMREGELLFIFSDPPERSH